MVSARASGAGGFGDVVAAPGAGGIQLPPGNYELAMRFDVPRAQLVDWRIVCPGVTLDGQAGETLEQYRARRIEELARERDRERDRVAAATSLVVGAVAPRVSANGRAGNVHVHADAGVDPNAVGAAVANGAVDNSIMLAPDDVGRGSVSANARVMTSSDGVCVLQVTADDADVRAAFTVTRIRDLDAEGRMRTIAAREVAVKARGQLSAQLVTGGADPSIHRAKVQAKYEQVHAREDLRARHEAAAIYARQEYLFYLEGKCNAKPGQREQTASARERRLMSYALIAQQRDQLALRARANISAQLLALGAKARPPRPEPLPETPGTAPFDGAEWQGGYWSWVSNEWEWQSGGWSDPDIFGDAGSIEVVGTNGTGNGYTHTYEQGTRDHRQSRDRVRDNRGDSSEPFRGIGVDKDKSRESKSTRDHRDEQPRDRWTPKDSGAKVRDHRDDDKKDDKKQDDDDKPRVRDHR